jgi:hypothetical protein
MMSLPLQAVERLFDRLSATYGREFFARYDGLDPNAIKSVWAHELSAYSHRLEDIAWALENLPERCPNAIEFRNICRKAPERDKPKLPEAPANLERLKSELAKLLPAIKAAQKVATNDGLAWARSIVEKYDSGMVVAPCTLRFAREALARRGVLV